MKTRKTAYVRVSTASNAQLHSYEFQEQYWRNKFAEEPDTEFVGIYADRGISGSSVNKRSQFLAMMEDARAHKFDEIHTKSVSRFARNTVQLLEAVRELRDLGIAVIFEKENIRTLDPTSEIFLTIAATIAENDLQVDSERQRWSIRHRIENGWISIGSGLYGYRMTEDNNLEIVPAEAEIVRRIYQMYIDGTGAKTIADTLNAEGHRTILGNEWSCNRVLEIIDNEKFILTNEKYTGNAILGKTYKPDVLTKYRQKNDGTKAPMYYTENSHPAIISPEMFEMVKKEMERRSAAKDATTGSSRFTSKYPFSGLLVCGTCGARLRRHARTVGTGDHVPAWGCAARIKEGRSVCDSHHVREDVLEKTYTAAIQQITESADEVTAAVSEGAMLTLEPENRERLEAVEQAIIETQEQALALLKKKSAHQITDAEYKDAIEKCSQRMKELETEQAKLQTIATRYSEVKAWLDTFEENVRSGDIMDANDAMVMKALVDEIIVNDTGIEIHCKCGVTIEQEYVR